MLALENVKYIAEKHGETFAYEKEIRETREAAQEAFFVAEDGAFTAERGEKKYTVLGNALAILSGVAAGETAKTVCEKIAKGKNAGLFAIDENVQVRRVIEVRQSEISKRGA